MQYLLYKIGYIIFCELQKEIYCRDVQRTLLSATEGGGLERGRVPKLSSGLKFLKVFKPSSKFCQICLFQITKKDQILLFGVLCRVLT